jgi:exopolysaccharide production protein ExoQ
MLRNAQFGRLLVASRSAAWNGFHWADIVLVIGVCLFPLISAYKIWSNVDGLLKYLGAIAILGMIARATAKVEAMRIIARLHTPLGSVAIAALAYAIASSFWAPSIGDSFGESLARAGTVALAVIIGTRLVVTANDQMQRAFAFATATGLVLLFFDAVTGFPVTGLFYPNLPDALINPNVMALTILAWLTMGTFALEEKKIGVWAVWVLAGAIVAMSRSEAAQLGFGAGSLILGLAYWSMPLAAWSSIVSCVAGLLLAPFVGAAAMFATTILPGHWIASAHVLERIEIWSRHAALIEQAPLFGHGFGGVERDHPHNAALQIWVEFGATGVLLTAATIALLGTAILRSPSPRKAFALACCVSIYANAYVSFGMWEKQWLGIVLMVAVIAASGLAVRVCREAG